MLHNSLGDSELPPISLKVRWGHSTTYKLQNFDRSITIQDVINWIIDKCDLDRSESYSLYSPSMANERWLDPKALVKNSGLNAKVSHHLFCNRNIYILC